MISLLISGFSMLVIGVSLMVLRNSLRRSGNVQVAVANQVRREGLIICVVGLLVLLVGIFSPLIISEARILMVSGASLMYVGLLSLIQWVVLSGRGTERHVYKGAWTVTWIGVALVVAYAIYRIMMI